jgi:hypothetical protein
MTDTYVRDTAGKFTEHYRTADSIVLEEPIATSAQQWDGDDDALIALDTNPWLQGADGKRKNLAFLRRKVLERHSCPCAGPIPGVIAPVDGDDYGIQRCDNCAVYDDDREAARALASRLGADVTVWFEEVE